MGKIAAAEEVLKALRLDAARSIEDSSIRGMLDEPSRELWDHDGTCVCGKRTYSFSRCPSCIALDTAVEISERAEPEAAADLDQESQEVSLEVGALVAATSGAGGAQELSSSMGHGLPVLSQEALLKRTFSELLCSSSQSLTGLAGSFSSSRSSRLPSELTGISPQKRGRA